MKYQNDQKIPGPIDNKAVEQLLKLGVDLTLPGHYKGTFNNREGYTGTA
jgi:hypothetical protein